MMPSPRASVLLPLTPTSPQGSLPVVFAREVKAGSGMPGRSVADGAKGLVEPGRSGDLGRLCTAGPLEESTWLAWGISPILGQREGSEQPGIYPGPHLGHPSIPKEISLSLGSLGRRLGNFQRKTSQDRTEERTLELHLAHRDLVSPSVKWAQSVTVTLIVLCNQCSLAWMSGQACSLALGPPVPSTKKPASNV